MLLVGKVGNMWWGGDLAKSDGEGVGSKFISLFDESSIFLFSIEWFADELSNCWSFWAFNAANFS